MTGNDEPLIRGIVQPRGTTAMKYKEHLPHASLHDHVKCFWTMERE